MPPGEDQDPSEGRSRSRGRSEGGDAEQGEAVNAHPRLCGMKDPSQGRNSSKGFISASVLGEFAISP